MPRNNLEVFEGSPKAIRDASQRQYKVFCLESNNESDSWVTYRGLYPSVSTKREKSYLELLPTFASLDFVQIIKHLLARNNATKPVVVDIGYGRGNALLDLYNEFGDQVTLMGYGDSNYSKKPLKSYLGGEQLAPPTFDQLQAASIKLISGDALDIRQELGDNSVDVIISVHTLVNIYYPRWELIKKLYRILRPKGFAFLHSISVFCEDENMNEYLNKLGYAFEIKRETSREWSGVSFQKTHSNISIPVRSVGHLLDERVVVRKKN